MNEKDLADLQVRLFDAMEASGDTQREIVADMAVGWASGFLDEEPLRIVLQENSPEDALAYMKQLCFRLGIPTGQ